MGYAGDVYEGEKQDSNDVCDKNSAAYDFCKCYPDAVTCNTIDLPEIVIDKCDPENVNYDFCKCNPGWCDSGDCTDSSSLAFPCGEQEDTDCNDDLGGTAYQTSCGCIGGDTGIDECPDEEIPTEPVNTERIWYLDYDSDGYHGSTYEAADKPGDKWKTTTSGIDCDDARSQYTTVCCTKTCESGYKLNIDNCECVLLPPCWGTIQDFETSNSFNSNTILNELNSALSTFGISTDIMDILNESKIFDPKIIAQSTDIATHANAIGNIGDGSQIIMSYFEYIDEPSTQNLLKLALDSVSPFLSPAASLALSTIDFYKDSNGDSKLDLLLRAAGDYIDRQRDCNLGLGVRNAIF